MMCFLRKKLPIKEIHFTEIDPRLWRWEYFKPSEIACKGDGLIKINQDALNRLEKFRRITGVPFTPNSAYRSVEYNKLVGGAPKSMHLQGKAFDIPIKGDMIREVIHANARLCGFTGFGDYNSFVHIDTGKPRYWDAR